MRQLSDEDVEALSDAIIDKMPVCQLGITSDEVVIMKGHIKAFKAAEGIIGKAVVYSIIIFVIALFSKGIVGWIKTL